MATVALGFFTVPLGKLKKVGNNVAPISIILKKNVTGKEFKIT